MDLNNGLAWVRINYLPLPIKKRKPGHALAAQILLMHPLPKNRHCIVMVLSLDQDAIITPQNSSSW